MYVWISVKLLDRATTSSSISEVVKSVLSIVVVWLGRRVDLERWVTLCYSLKLVCL